MMARTTFALMLACFVLFQISNISHHYFLLCLLLPGAYYYNALFCNFAISTFPNNKALSYGQDGQFVVQQRIFLTTSYFSISLQDFLTINPQSLPCSKSWSTFPLLLRSGSRPETKPFGLFPSQLPLTLTKYA